MKKQCERIIRTAFSSVPMYHFIAQRDNLDIDRIIREDCWDELPVTDKNLVITEGESAIAAHGVPLLLANRLITGRTSGSTGKYMETCWKPSEYNKSMLPLWYYRYHYYGIRPEDRCCFFYTIGEVGTVEGWYRREKNSLGFSKSHVGREELAEILEMMRKFRPKWLMLQPSIAFLLCRYMEHYGTGPPDSVEYIEFTGEILTESIRQMTKKYFQCSVANQYGANEFNSIAYECPCGNLHIMESNVYVEVKDKKQNVLDGEEGELYITTLTNTVMPLIRYRIGDKGKLFRKKVCPCGNPAAILQLSSGRTNDLILCEDGEYITSYSLVRAIDNTNYLMEGIIRQFQIIQEGINDFTIRLVLDDEDDGFDEDAVSDCVLESITDPRLLGAEYGFEFYSDLFPDEATGKFRYFINRCSTKENEH